MNKNPGHGRHQANRSRKSMLAAAAATALLMTLAVAPAHAVAYRCELAPAHKDGPPAVRYQSQPCDGGRAVHNPDHRTDAQRADTAKATLSSAKLGKQLERQRRRQEKQGADRPPVAMDQATSRVKPDAASTQGQTLKRPRPFTVKVPKAKATADGSQRQNKRSD